MRGLPAGTPPAASVKPPDHGCDGSTGFTLTVVLTGASAGTCPHSKRLLATLSLSAARAFPGLYRAWKHWLGVAAYQLEGDPRHAEAVAAQVEKNSPEQAPDSTSPGKKNRPCLTRNSARAMARVW